eukprot:TRINITY_DN40501_c0_g1_i1.p1 TRINITY_DN40501_c0_g1~~TRINITY_DN40501_c0_g1_i1.p1  ORF type:complete len:431 (+),score=136.99 TRINITY_DN40501_c0_g1_i1:53-1345(+)
MFRFARLRPLASCVALLGLSQLPLGIDALRIAEGSEDASVLSEASAASSQLQQGVAAGAYRAALRAFIEERRSNAEAQLTRARADFAKAVVEDVAAFKRGKVQAADADGHEISSSQGASGGLHDEASSHGRHSSGEEELAERISSDVGKYKEKARRVSSEFRAQLMGNIDAADYKIDEAKKEFIDVFIEEVAKYKEEAMTSKLEAERELQEELQHMEEEAKKRSDEEILRREEMVARMKQGEAQLAKLMQELAGLPAAVNDGTGPQGGDYPECPGSGQINNPDDHPDHQDPPGLHDPLDSHPKFGPAKPKMGLPASDRPEPPCDADKSPDEAGGGAGAGGGPPPGKSSPPATPPKQPPVEAGKPCPCAGLTDNTPGDEDGPMAAALPKVFPGARAGSGDPKMVQGLLLAAQHAATGDTAAAVQMAKQYLQ